MQRARSFSPYSHCKTSIALKPSLILQKEHSRASRKALDLVALDERLQMLPMLDQAEAAVAALLNARSKELRESVVMEDTVQTASEHALAASSLIEEANDAAIFDMTLSGEDAVISIDDTLTRLVDENFNQFQNALSIRGDINLIAGLAIAFSQNDEAPNQLNHRRPGNIGL